MFWIEAILITVAGWLILIAVGASWPIQGIAVTVLLVWLLKQKLKRSDD